MIEIRFVVREHSGSSRKRRKADIGRRWWRRVDENTLTVLAGEDKRGRFGRFIVQCPDCGQMVSSPPLRSPAEVDALLDSDLTDHHRCTALERN